ncbi:MAG: BA14K family protein [Oricola sp.]
MKLKMFLTTALLSCAAAVAPQAGSAMPSASHAVEARTPLVAPVHGDIYWRYNRPYWNGYPGYPAYRPGYRPYGGFWFPNSAFGIIITPTPRYRTYRYYEPGPGIEPTYQLTTQHYRWCENRYRSYRQSDNTFQPYNGPRRQCVSPYMYRIR